MLKKIADIRKLALKLINSKPNSSELKECLDILHTYYKKEMEKD